MQGGVIKIIDPDETRALKSVEGEGTWYMAAGEQVKQDIKYVPYRRDCHEY
jgi:hypothetical protein